MSKLRQSYVHEAALLLDQDVDPQAPGGAVTTALCGHWRHEGACHWPHNNEIDCASTPAMFRTLFVATPADEAEVRKRIDAALATAHGWSLTSSGPRAVRDSEGALARRLVDDI